MQSENLFPEEPSPQKTARTPILQQKQKLCFILEKNRKFLESQKKKDNPKFSPKSFMLQRGLKLTQHQRFFFDLLVVNANKLLELIIHEQTEESWPKAFDATFTGG